jgi:hypothetical protein
LSGACDDVEVIAHFSAITVWSGPADDVLAKESYTKRSGIQFEVEIVHEGPKRPTILADENFMRSINEPHQSDLYVRARHEKFTLDMTE